MSCHEKSNSPVTSLAKFVSGQPESVVNHTFHDLRAEAEASMGKEESKKLANQDEVIAFLKEQLETAKSDPRIRDAMRAKLVDRFNTAIARAIDGSVIPNQAWFAAWRRLTPLVMSDNPSIAGTSNELVGVTPDGFTITATEVQAAYTRAEHARIMFGPDEPHNPTQAPNQTRSFYAQAEHMQAALDATEAGMNALLELPAANPDHAEHAQWLGRFTRAQEARASAHEITIRKQAGAKVPYEQAKAGMAAAHASLQAMQLDLDGTPEAIERLNVARRNVHDANVVWLYAMAHKYPVINNMVERDLRSPQTWSGMLLDDVHRTDVWRAVEMLATDRDRAAVRIGRISDLDAAKRRTARAEARQSLLDGEGAGLIDPVNRRFAEAVRMRRGIRT